jgi:pyruvate dehydrogenase E1 component alpha subunit
MGRPGRDEDLYLAMCRIRFFEQAMRDLWDRGLVSGEMHLGIGEEAVAAGVVSHLHDGDALALDYRSTPPLVARGVDLEQLLLEVLGSPDGLCGGRAGHMHLMSVPHLAAASGIVGAPGPLVCGFGLAAQHAGDGRVAVAFFGDGAVNEGMTMEALNLAAVWRLPVLFVCKDNRWAVTTRSAALTGGGLARRLGAFGLPVVRVDGTDVEEVDRVSGRLLRRLRGGGPATVLLARCERAEGHFLGDPLVRLAGAVDELAAEVRPLVAQLGRQPGAALADRVAALASIGRRVATVGMAGVVRPRRGDPLLRAARRLPETVARAAERCAQAEVDAAVAAALEHVRGAVDG